MTVMIPPLSTPHGIAAHFLFADEKPVIKYTTTSEIKAIGAIVLFGSRENKQIIEQNTIKATVAAMPTPAPNTHADTKPELCGCVFRVTDFFEVFLLFIVILRKNIYNKCMRRT